MAYKTDQERIKEDLIANNAAVSKTEIAQITQWEVWFACEDAEDAKLMTAAPEVGKKYPGYTIRFDKYLGFWPCIVFATNQPKASIGEATTKK